MYMENNNNNKNKNAMDKFITLKEARLKIEDHLYSHEGECEYNEYQQCIKGYRYFCWQCHRGVRGMMSECQNKNCIVVMKEKST